VDEHAAAVAGVAAAFDEAATLQAVQQGRDGRRAHAGRLGDAARRDVRLACGDVETFEIGGIEPEAFGHRLVQDQREAGLESQLLADGGGEFWAG
jgi:hypothetical protein